MKMESWAVAVSLLLLPACSAPGGIPHPAPVPRHAPSVQVLVIDRPERADSLAGRETSLQGSGMPTVEGAATGEASRPLVGRISGSLPEIPEPQPQPDPDETRREGWPVAYNLGEADWPERRILTNYYRRGGFGINPLGVGLGIAIGHSFHRGAGRWLLLGPALALRGAARLFR